MASWSKTPSSSGASSIKSSERDAAPAHAPAPAPASADSVEFATGSVSRVVRRVFHSFSKAEERQTSSGAASRTHKRVKLPPESGQPHDYCQSAPSSTNSKPPAGTHQYTPPADSLSSSTTIASSTSTTKTTSREQTRVLTQSTRTHHVKANSESEHECDDGVRFATDSQSLLVLPPSTPAAPSAPSAPSPAARKLFDNLLIRPKVHSHSHTNSREQLQHASTEPAFGANGVATGQGAAPAIDPLPRPPLLQHQHVDDRFAHLIGQLHALSASSSSLPIRRPSDPQLYAFSAFQEVAEPLQQRAKHSSQHIHLLASLS